MINPKPTTTSAPRARKGSQWPSSGKRRGLLSTTYFCSRAIRIAPPSEVDVTTQLTKTIKLNIPILSAAMDTVTEGPLAIAMAQAGGIGVIHRNLEPEVQAQHIQQVKKFESGMVVNPVTIAPGATLKDALALMKSYKSQGFPVVEPPSNGGGQGRLVGIVTNRDCAFSQPIRASPFSN